MSYHATHCRGINCNHAECPICIERGEQQAADAGTYGNPGFGGWDQ